jgi:hypothetical protein
MQRGEEKDHPTEAADNRVKHQTESTGGQGDSASQSAAMRECAGYRS